MKKIVTLSLLSLSVCAAFGQATTPAVSTPLYYCQAASAAPLTATAGSSSDTLYWYTAATGGSGSRTAPVPSTATAGTVKYYVSAKPASGAESPRAEIAVYTSPAIPPFQLRTTDSLLCIGESTKLFSGLAASGTLSTPLIDDNKSRGIMFDILAKRGLMITGFEVHTEIVSGEPFRIYYKTGSSSGYESSAAAWTLLGSVALSGSTGVTSIPLPVNVTIPAGQTAAFYLTNTGTANVRYHEGTGAGTVFKEDDNLQILEGVGKAFPFGSTSANRRFEGIVKYEKLSATWSTGALTDTITAMPALTTKYWATISNTAGCMATDTIPVQVAPLAAAPVANSPVVYCQYAASAPLSATKGNASDTLLWYTSATGGTGSKTAPSPATAAAGTFYYYVSAKTSSGCEGARDTVEVRVNPAAAAPVAASPVTYCRYAAATALTATAGSASDTLLWYTMATGGTGSKTAPVPSTASAGTTYRYVSAKSSLGCEGMRDTIEVRVQAAAGTPTVSTPVRYCRGAAAVPLTAGKGTASDTL
ncbi:MAG: hypothetical protein JNL13_07000, partial [Chitinophagaceae bacterium]|nr:hypothetical protein [Chitinophagaceae bacterium]